MGRCGQRPVSEVHGGKEMDRRIPVLIGKNIVRAMLLVFAVSIVTFWLMKASPMDPLQTNVGQAALGSMSREQIEKLEE